MLGGDVFVLERFGLGLGAFDHFLQARRDVGLAGVAGDLRQAIESFLQTLDERTRRHAEFLQQRDDHSLFLAQQREQQVLYVDGLVVALFGEPLSLLQRFL